MLLPVAFDVLSSLLLLALQHNGLRHPKHNSCGNTKPLKLAAPMWRAS
jgi:hypothetical protein